MLSVFQSMRSVSYSNCSEEPKDRFAKGPYEDCRRRSDRNAPFFFWSNILCITVKLGLGALQMPEVNIRFFSLNLGKSSLNLPRKGGYSHQRSIQLADESFGLRDLGSLRRR